MADENVNENEEVVVNNQEGAPEGTKEEVEETLAAEKAETETTDAEAPEEALSREAEENANAIQEAELATAEVTPDATVEVKDNGELEVVEQHPESPDLAKMIQDFSNNIQKALETSHTETAAELAKVNARLAAVDAVASKIEELGAKHAELAEKFDAVNTQLDSVEKRFKAINETVGVRKSGDLGGSTEDKLEKSSKSLWGGRFLGSVDNI